MYLVKRAAMTMVIVVVLALSSLPATAWDRDVGEARTDNGIPTAKAYGNAVKGGESVMIYNSGNTLITRGYARDISNYEYQVNGCVKIYKGKGAVNRPDSVPPGPGQGPMIDMCMTYSVGNWDHYGWYEYDAIRLSTGIDGDIPPGSYTYEVTASSSMVSYESKDTMSLRVNPEDAEVVTPDPDKEYVVRGIGLYTATPERTDVVISFDGNKPYKYSELFLIEGVNFYKTPEGKTLVIINRGGNWIDLVVPWKNELKIHMLA